MPSEQRLHNRNHWFDTSSIHSMQEVVSANPGKIIQLLDSAFEVVTPWSSDGLISSAGRRILRDVWSPGAIGSVEQIQFDQVSGWQVYVEYQGPAADLFFEVDEKWLDTGSPVFVAYAATGDGSGRFSGTGVPHQGCER